MAFTSRALAPNARIGTLLCQKWRIGPILGTGGMSTVYRAVHRNGKEVAIKVLHPELTQRERTRRRFLREGYIANRVDHPGAVSVLDDGVADDGTVFLVMELLHGETVGNTLKRRGASYRVEEVLAVADGVLDVLASAHEKGIVHRDVKPDNVFVTCDGRLKLLDFGIASVRELSAVGAEVTLAGLALGTPAFMAPEQARGGPGEVDHRTDLWAVGAMMFTLFTQQLVHEGRSGNEALVLAATRPSRSVRELASELDARVAEVVDRALAFAKADRWPQARAMQAALRAAAGHLHLVLPVPAGPHSSSYTEATCDTPSEPEASVWTHAHVDTGSAAKHQSWSRWTLAAGMALGIVTALLLLRATRAPSELLRLKTSFRTLPTFVAPLNTAEPDLAPVTSPADTTTAAATPPPQRGSPGAARKRLPEAPRSPDAKPALATRRAGSDSDFSWLMSNDVLDRRD
jgi:serine/threonine-protein kinase